MFDDLFNLPLEQAHLDSNGVIMFRRLITVLMAVALSLVFVSNVSPASAGGTGCSGTVGIKTSPSFGQLHYDGRTVKQTVWILDTTGCTKEVVVKALAFTITTSHGVPTVRWTPAAGIKITSISWQYANPSNSKDTSYQMLAGTPSRLTLGSFVYKVWVNGRHLERLPKIVAFDISFADSIHRSASMSGS